MTVELKKISDLEFSYAKILVFGESGSGKTYFASTYIPEKTLFVNVKAESGMMTLRALGVEMDVLEVDTYADMKNVIQWVKTNGQKYDLIYIDSLSQWQKNLEKEIPESNNRFAKWNTIKDYTREIVDAFKALPFHVVFTCEIKKDKDEDAGTITYNPSLLGSSRDDIPYWFDEVYYFIRFQQKVGEPISYKALTAAAMRYPCKSRLRLPSTIDNPKLLEILNNAVFKKVDKDVQVQELKISAEIINPISKLNRETLRELINKKLDDATILKFLKHYGAENIPGFPDDKVSEAISELQKLKDKDGK